MIESTIVALRDCHLKSISRVLFEYRKENNLTQKDLAEELSYYSPEFKALNMVTLSRWENTYSNPSLHKKKILLHFFAEKGCLNSGPCHDILRTQYVNLTDTLSNIFTKNYQYIIGNLPEQPITEYTMHTLKDFTDANEYMEHIIDIERASNAENYYTITSDILKEWSNHPSTFAVVCVRKKQHLGHFIMLKLKNHVAEEIVHHRRSKFDIKEEDLCTPEEKGTYCIHAFYGKNPKIAALLNVKAYVHFFDHLSSIDNVMIFSSRADGVLLTKDYGIKMVAKGRDEAYDFNWYGMLSPVEDILFSDTVVKLID